jgi:hypothetical protein
MVKSVQHRKDKGSNNNIIVFLIKSINIIFHDTNKKDNKNNNYINGYKIIKVVDFKKRINK